ncbi:MAG: methyltransferase domain-containing protein [Alphaproteobacteria bacterium]
MSASLSSGAMEVFDRIAVRRHRNRAAPDFGAHDFLLREVAARLGDRLDDVRRAFPTAVDLGCHTGQVAQALAGRAGIRVLLQTDLSEAMVRRSDGLRLVADEEALPFAPASLDLVVSCLGLHWVNDLPGTLVQVRHALRPDGLFLAAMLGGDTLFELRHALLQAEAETAGGVSPRVSPMADLRDAAGLLQRAGFALPVADLDTITVSYADPVRLMRDLRGMAQSNAVLSRRRSSTRRDTMMRAAALLLERFGDAEGRIPLTFQVIWLMAWSPAASQPRPRPRGSAAMRLADALRDAPSGDTVSDGRPGAPESPPATGS